MRRRPAVSTNIVPRDIVAGQSRANSEMLITESGEWLRVVDDDQQGGALRAT